MKGRGLSQPRPINVLTFSTLYPNREMPYLGIFVENRLRQLIARGEVAVAVPIATAPSRVAAELILKPTQAERLDQIVHGEPSIQITVTRPRRALRRRRRE